MNGMRAIRNEMLRIVLFIAWMAATLAWFPSFYPQYCTKNVATREIPPLSSSEQAQVDSLVQLQVVVRHGARTPYAEFSCWQNYSVQWNNCNVTDLMLASPSMTSQDRPATWLFRKLYDGSANYLGGNCLTGQLLSEGYTQENALGIYLYNSYLNNPDSALNLFNTSVWTDIDTDKYIYLRSDDQERTLMSAQILLHAMFNISEEVIVPWHTGDYGLDQLYPNDEVCPKLDTVADSAYSSPEFLQENNSASVNQLTAELNDIFGAGYWDWDHVFDCLMTTVCTSNQVPDGMTQEIFNATIAQAEFSFAYLNLYNDSQYAKLAMGNTAWHIRNNIEAVLNNQSYALKFALFGGHDTTIMPLLAAILGDQWDKVWPGYASMISIEIYNATAGGYLFRMIYNGDVLLVPGCTTGLCDLQVLLDALAFGSEDMPCSTTTSNVVVDDGCGDGDDDGLSNDDVVLVAFMSALLGGLLGAGAVVFVEKRRSRGKMTELTAPIANGSSSNPVHENSKL